MSFSLLGRNLLRQSHRCPFQVANLECYHHHQAMSTPIVASSSSLCLSDFHPHLKARRRGITRPQPPPPPPPPPSSSSSLKSRHIPHHLLLHHNARYLQCRSLHISGLEGGSSLHQSIDTCTMVPSEPKMDPFKLVEKDLDNLYITIRQELSNTSLAELREVACYYFDGQGKALRPLIVILIARAMNAHLTSRSELLNTQKSVSLIIEMIHTASLIHDDVIDSADTRRGKPSVNVIWGIKKSIIAGDFVISQASQTLARLNDASLTSTLSEAIVDLVLGEFMQMGNKEDVQERFAHYIEKTFKKTASLIAFTCKAVTYLAGADERLQEAAFLFGRNLGIAFQLVDDLLDFVSNQAELGKPAAADLKLGLATAPVLFACEKFPELNELIIRRFAQPGDVEKAYDAVMKSDGIYQTRLLAQKHADEAARHIAPLVDTPEKEALMVLCDMVLSRKK